VAENYGNLVIASYAAQSGGNAPPALVSQLVQEGLGRQSRGRTTQGTNRPVIRDGSPAIYFLEL
jgi:hypothetical protein